MKRKGYYEYDPVIYPRMLCVAIGLNQEDANKCFEGRKGEVLKVDFSDYDAATYGEVREKPNKKLCSLINFASKDSMRMGVCCHEASHACDAIENAIGMQHGGEPSAYLIVWIVSCINKARLGIGDFVEIKDKEITYD